MMPFGSFWREFYVSFKKTGGFVFGLVGVFLGGWAIFYNTPFQIDGRWLIGVVVFAYMILAPFADLAARAHAAVTPRTKVDGAMKIGAMPYLLVSPAHAFGIDTAVIVYQIVDGFEIEIGIGRAKPISEGRAQIAVVNTRDRDALWSKICDREAGVLATLVVRPGLPFDFYQRRA